MAEAVGNLAENAARHAQTEVSIHARREGGFIVLTIADDGEGIPPEQLEEALSRGGRLDRSGSGAGLGLSIVGDIAEAWDGRFEIRNTARRVRGGNLRTPSWVSARGQSEARLRFAWAAPWP